MNKNLLLYLIGIVLIATKLLANSNYVYSEEIAMELPNYEQVTDSPILEKVGVAVKIGAKVFKSDEPLVVYGSYLVGEEFVKKSNDEPDAWIILIVIRKDKPEVWSKSVLDKPNLAPIPDISEEPSDPSFRSGGYFNLDLREHFGFSFEHGKYRLIVSMGDYITDLMSFEIIE